MKRMKQLLCITLAFSMLLCLAACGKKPETKAEAAPLHIAGENILPISVEITVGVGVFSTVEAKLFLFFSVLWHCAGSPSSCCGNGETAGAKGYKKYSCCPT